MTTEWLIYPDGDDEDGEWTTVTWSDGSSQQVPTKFSNSDGLERLADSARELFRIRYFHIGYGGTSTYPVIWRFPNDVLVLQAYDDENFNCHFICQSKDIVECITSWLRGEVVQQVDGPAWISGTDPSYYFHTREILAFGASDLLTKVNHLQLEAWKSNSRLLLPPDRPGLKKKSVHAAHLSMFWDRFLETQDDLVEQLEQLDCAVQVSGSLSAAQWQLITSWCYEGSQAQRLNLDTVTRDKWNDIVSTVESLNPEFESEWARNRL